MAGLPCVNRCQGLRPLLRANDVQRTAVLEDQRKWLAGDDGAKVCEVSSVVLMDLLVVGFAELPGVSKPAFRIAPWTMLKLITLPLAGAKCTIIGTELE